MGKPGGKGKGGKPDFEAWMYQCMEQWMDWNGKGSSKGSGKGRSKGKGKSKGKSKRKKEGDDSDEEGGLNGDGSRKRKRHVQEERDLEPLKADVMAVLEENGGSFPLSDVASKCPCRKVELVEIGFVFGPPNDEGDVFVYPPDFPLPDPPEFPPSRIRRRTEIEVMSEILDFMDENGGHAALRDLHKNFKLKPQPKKRLEALGFTFGDHEEHGGCEVIVPPQAQGDERPKFIEAAAKTAERLNIYGKHFGKK